MNPGTCSLGGNGGEGRIGLFCQNLTNLGTISPAPKMLSSPCLESFQWGELCEKFGIKSLFCAQFWILEKICHIKKYLFWTSLLPSPFPLPLPLPLPLSFFLSLYFLFPSFFLSLSFSLSLKQKSYHFQLNLTWALWLSNSHKLLINSLTHSSQKRKAILRGKAIGEWEMWMFCISISLRSLTLSSLCLWDLLLNLDIL